MTDRPAPDAPRQAGVDAHSLPETDSMVRHEEELVVDTHRVQIGRVRLRKRVVEEERTFTVTVRHEEVDVIEEAFDADAATEGRSVDPDEAIDVTGSGAGRAGGTHADDGADGADTVEIVLYAEQPVVTMERVPVERVRLRRVRTRQEQTVTEDVRREDILIDRDDLREQADQPDGLRGSDQV